MNEQDKRLNEFRALVEAATPGPWKRSYFVDKKHYHMTEQEKHECHMQERHIIRGKGRVGTPECNAIIGINFALDSDIDLIAAAPEALTYTLDIIARQDAEIRDLKEKNSFLVDVSDKEAKGRILCLINRNHLAAECKAKDARIEALEQAIGEVAKAGKCAICARKTKCPDGVIEEIGVFGECFVFDEARFREGGGER